VRAHKPACLRRCGRPRRTADPGPKGTHSEVGCRTVWAGPQADQVTRRRRASASAARHQRQADDRFAHEPATWRLRSWSGFFIACVAAFAVCRWRDAGRYGPPATRWEQLADLKAAPMGLASWPPSSLRSLVLYRPRVRPSSGGARRFAVLRRLCDTSERATCGR